MKVGFIGLGRMGGTMAANLVKLGHEVTVWTGRQTRPPLSLPPAHDGPTDQRTRGEVVMSVLADDAAVGTVAFGEGGIADAPALHVSHSSIGIDLAKRLIVRRGVRLGTRE